MRVLLECEIVGLRLDFNFYMLRILIKLDFDIFKCKNHGPYMIFLRFHFSRAPSFSAKLRVREFSHLSLAPTYIASSMLTTHTPDCYIC